MSAEVLVFDILGVIAVIAALGVITLRNPVHSAVALVVTFVNLAGIFVLLRAEFLGAVQIIVYTGAILVLMLFVIMLVHLDDLPEFHRGAPMQKVIAFIVGLVLFGELAVAVLTRTVVGRPDIWNEENVAAAGGNVQVLGQFMYSGYVLPIQAVAIVLLVGTIGALVMARPEDSTVKQRSRQTGTISLAHPRGTGGEFYDPAMLPSGTGAAGTSRAQLRGEMRGGVVMVRDADAYTDTPAWELEFQQPRGREVSYAEDGQGVGEEGDRS